MKLPMMEVRSLAPIIDDRSLVLILGTMPGNESLRQQEYYAHPQNQFWRILAGVYGESLGSTYQERVPFLIGKRLALWDVLKSAERKGSSDREIRMEVANDFAALIAEYPNLRTLAFNGRRAKEFFRRLVEKRQPPGELYHLRRLVLPSSSPTPGEHVLSLEDKIVRWQALRDDGIRS